MSDTPPPSDEHGQPPFFKVESGDPSDEELAALVAVFAAKATAAAVATSDAPRRPAWADPAHRVRRPHEHGPGVWRASARPR